MILKLAFLDVFTSREISREADFYLHDPLPFQAPSTQPSPPGPIIAIPDQGRARCVWTGGWGDGEFSHEEKNLGWRLLGCTILRNSLLFKNISLNIFPNNNCGLSYC